MKRTANGIPCYDCGTNTKVDTTQNHGKGRRRYVSCPDCGTKMITLEQIIKVKRVIQSKTDDNKHPHDIVEV